MPRKGYERGFQPVLPLDAMILELLPDEGTMFAGFFMEGVTVRQVVEKLGGSLSSDTISSRLRVLHQFGHAAAHRVPKQSTQIWQTTPLGREFQLKHRPKES